MFEKLNVKEGIMSVIKNIDEKKAPPREPTASNNEIDYLRGDHRQRAGTTIGTSKTGKTSPKPRRAGTVKNK